MQVDNRPNRHARIFIELELIAQWATCQRGRVASALVDFEGVIRVPSRNGTPRKVLPCSNFTDGVDRCQYCVHSETNVINHAAKAGIITAGFTIYTLKRPCINCANNIVQADIGCVYYREDYDTDNGFEYVSDMFSLRGIVFQKIEPTLEEVTFSKMLEEWRKTWDRPKLRSI